MSDAQVIGAGEEVPAEFLGNKYAVFPWIGCDLPGCLYCSDGLV